MTSNGGDAAAPPTASAQSWLGRVIDGRYRVERVLGEGGMGAVFAAEHLGLSKSVALKIILPELAGDVELAQRFAREAMVSARLDHAHVASALDFGSLPDGGAYLVMQLARGQSLRAFIREPGDWRFAVRVGAQIASALGAAHAHGIVHRDLKPDNVLVEDLPSGPHARVVDFGIARVTDATRGAPLTRLGTVMGTPGYMAPEQAVGEVVDARADVYALGVIIWELATGRRLFGGGDLGQIVSMQLTATAPSLASVVREIPGDVSVLVAKMLEGSRSSRPASGAEVCESLAAMLHHAGAVVPESTGGPSRTVSNASDTIVSSPEVSPHAATEIARTPAPPRQPSPATTLRVGRPSRGSWMVILATSFGVGLLALVALSCVVTRIGCSGADSTPVATLPAAPASAPPAAHGFEEIPSGLSSDLAALQISPEADVRRASAARLMPYRAELPEFVRGLLAYETGADCRARQRAIRSISELRDGRALPALERIAAQRARDDRCLRHDLERAIRRLSEPP